MPHMPGRHWPPAPPAAPPRTPDYIARSSTRHNDPADTAAYLASSGVQPGAAKADPTAPWWVYPALLTAGSAASFFRYMALAGVFFLPAVWVYAWPAGPGQLLRYLGQHRRTRVAVVLTVVAAVALAIVSIPATAATGPAAPRRPAAWQQPNGTTAQHLMTDPRRSYVLHTAPGAPGSRPLIVGLPGSWHTPAILDRMAGLTAYGDAHGLNVAFGVTVDGRWNAGRVCCSSSAAQNDVRYVRALVADAARRTRTDLSRVYVLGFSGGGMMAWRVACEAPDLIAGAGVVSGALLVPCKTRVRVYHVHGAADRTVPLAGGRGFEGRVFPDANTEPSRVGPGSTLRLHWWSGGHVWSSRTTGIVLGWLRWQPAPHPGTRKAHP